MEAGEGQGVSADGGSSDGTTLAEARILVQGQVRRVCYLSAFYLPLSAVLLRLRLLLLKFGCVVDRASGVSVSVYPFALLEENASWIRSTRIRQKRFIRNWQEFWDWNHARDYPPHCSCSRLVGVSKIPLLR